MRGRALLNYLKVRFLGGVIFALGIATAGLFAAAVSGTINTFASGEIVSAAKLNENFATLKAAVEAIHPPDSTSEVAAGRTWIDGKAIYRKVVNVGTLPNSTFTRTAHGISSLATVISVHGMATNGFSHLNLPHIDKDVGTTANIQINVEPADVLVFTSMDFTAYSGFIILEYTKN